MKKPFVYFVMLLGIIIFSLFYGMSRDPVHIEKKQQAATEATKMIKATTATSTAKSSLRPAPDFTLKTLSGEEITLSDYRGRYVLLNMWASWCAPCQQEMPHLVNIDRTYDNQKLMVLGVNMTSQEVNVKNVRDFVGEYHVQYPILLDEKSKVMNMYHVVGIPTSYLLDKEGRVIKQFRGVITLDGIKNTLRN